jgi:hypothetical protein
MRADGPKHSPPGHPADTPTFSVVVTSRGSAEALRGMLAALLPLCAAHGVQAVAVRAGPADDAPALEDVYPGVLVLLLPGGTAAGELRAAGMAAADGDVVLLGADDDPALPERLLHLLRSHGAMDPGAGAPLPERSQPAGGRPERQADGEDSASRQDLPSRNALETSECHSRPPQQHAAWTGSPRATGSSSSVPVPAG